LNDIPPINHEGVNCQKIEKQTDRTIWGIVETSTLVNTWKENSNKLNSLNRGDAWNKIQGLLSLGNFIGALGEILLVFYHCLYFTICFSFSCCFWIFMFWISHVFLFHTRVIFCDFDMISFIYCIFIGCIYCVFTERFCWVVLFCMFVFFI